MTGPKILDAQETSELLNLPISKIRSMTRLNLIPHYKIGHYCRYNQEKLLSWLEQLEKGGDHNEP